MSKRHNLGTVIHFEFIRTIKKPSFWVATLAFPVMLAAIFGIVFYSSSTTAESNDKLAKERFSIQYKDDSKSIIPKIADSFEAKAIDSRQQGIDNVKNHKVDAFFYYPANIAEDSVEVYGKDSGLFDNGKYSSVAQILLNTSADLQIGDANLTAVAKGGVSIKSTTFKEDGEKSAGWLAAAPPMIFLVLLYFTVVMLGGNLLNSTVEEKENRVTEMILTTLNPTNLIVGKLVATYMAGLVQALVLIAPIIVAYLILGSEASTANLPDLGMIDQLTFDPVAMTIGGLLFIGGLLLFTGSLVAVGAIMPTAKEASQYFGITLIMMFIPFYILTLILSDPDALIVQIFTFFPFTAPITASLRNAFGSLSTTDAIIVISELLVLGVLVIHFAVRLFRYGAMQYSSKLSLSTIFSKK